MLVHQIFQALRRVLPSPLAKGVRAFGTACLTPLHFSVSTGHFRSSLLGRAVNRHGGPLPWYTYAAIDFLSAQDFAGRSILEFGGGQSTMWWANRAERVVALEGDPEWVEYLRPRLPANADLRLVSGTLDRDLGLNLPHFDVVVVDGLNRLRAARVALRLVSPEGAILVDDSEGHWGADDGSRPIIETLRDAGFLRVDFYGFAPGVIKPRCTSLFFRSGCFLVSGKLDPCSTPLSVA
jgi:hypothetical protein